MKRRSVAIGLGALATGSGAVFSSAALQATVNSESTLEVFSVAELNVTRGIDQISGFTYDSEYDIQSREDLPDAYVNDGSTQSGNLLVEVATRNSDSTKSFPYLLEVTNNGTSEVNVGVGFDSFGADVGSEGTISKDAVMNTYDFKANPGRSTSGIEEGDIDISANSEKGDQTPANYKPIPPGESLAVDLDVDPAGSLVKNVNEAIDPTNSFNSSDTSGVTLVNSITFRTKN